MTNSGVNRREAKSSGNKIKPQTEQAHLYRRSWRNWFMLVGVLILTTIGLVTALPPLLDERVKNPWPWVKTDMILLVGFSVMVLIFIAYMTQQQKHVINLHKHLEIIKNKYSMRDSQNEKRLYALTSMGRIMGYETNLQNIFNAITKICSETFQSDRASLMLYDEETKDLVVQSVCGQSSEEILYIRQKAFEGIAGWVAQNRQPLLLGSSDDHEKYPDLEFNDSSITSAMLVPIIVREELVGIINVSSRTIDLMYERDDIRALQVFAENAGVCIRHTELINWIKKIRPQLNVDAPKKATVKK